MKYCTTIFLLALSLMACICNAQSDLVNLNKYWAYRDRFVKNFVHAGKEAGESLPMSARRIGFPSGSLATFNETASGFYWQDGTIYLGPYMQVLATEYRLLADADQNTEQTLNEIYYCLTTLNRLDIEAEYYLSQNQNSLGPEDLNGFFLRDDVSYDAGQELSGFCEDDYSVVFNRECNFARSNSDFFSAADWWNSETDTEYNGANGMFQTKKKQSCVSPIAVAWMRYYLISEAAIQKEWIFVSNNELYQNLEENAFLIN